MDRAARREERAVARVVADAGARLPGEELGAVVDDETQDFIRTVAGEGFHRSIFDTKPCTQRDEFRQRNAIGQVRADRVGVETRSEEHTSELQSLMRISYAVFCLKKKKTKTVNQQLTIIKYIIQNQ